MAADWPCPRCDHQNQGWREFCVRCRAQRTSVGRLGPPVVPPPAGPGSTRSGVLRLVAAGIAGLAIAAGAIVTLDRLNGDEAAGPPSTRPGPGPVATGDAAAVSIEDLPERLERMLPQAHELGAGWRRVVRANSDDRVPEPPDQDDVQAAAAACGISETAAADTGAPNAYAAFEGSTSGSYAAVAVSFEADVAAAQAQIDGVINPSFAECLRTTMQSQGEAAGRGVFTVETTATLLPAPAGVETGAGLRVTATASAGTFDLPLFVDVIAARKDRAFVFYLFLSVGAPVPQTTIDRVTAGMVAGIDPLIDQAS